MQIEMKNVGSEGKGEFHTCLEEQVKEFTNIGKNHKNLDKEIEAKESRELKKDSRIKELIASSDEELKRLQEIVKHMRSTQKKNKRAHFDAIKNIDDATCGLNFLFDRSLSLESDAALARAKYEGLLLKYDYWRKKVAECEQRMKKESRNLIELLLELKPLEEGTSK
ncbi:uncharacterized protein LOC110836272 [Zootermopsis nevadensis]|uniref:Uncharacterized protein n=1 Tax=Zootermopsis nevadensis TaxID=136037 RepID=A0A067RX07_ZOONE|nr:uncharacterized protein LOC110836272 [Zootermopsis nevadensis]XP_021933122.1 uncharacterized protein LOC110836272 [Zootermopsis nevadensis]XP_021933200.1 uncharacterized protein LOC110836272 [Zootermopsis nevadensis]XP_021933284.1 uncharacterized protein LOC110836272 [Zootermopsis nevadensis]XP_021933358.1 uncharacterized protein LOC110836272 [Zootermopsis nevadensis]XP_021933449.1 uncharacterized protein LOC110836272 [Zootermopsis nevadensis]XP_021933526.1 uncharacterized protein LOC11083